jgi:hypothetical protein
MNAIFFAEISFLGDSRRDSPKFIDLPEHSLGLLLIMAGQATLTDTQ